MRLALLLLATLLAGCGAQLAGPSTPGAPGKVTASSGQFHASAAPARPAAGETVHVTLTVTGPIDYETGCVQTLHIWADDGKGNRVWEEPVPAIMCFAYGHQTLSSDETATFTADWPTSTQLAGGAYVIHGLFLTVLPPGAGARVRENLPPLTVHVRG